MDQDWPEFAQLAEEVQPISNQSVETAFVDQGCAGAATFNAAAEHRIHLEVVKHHEVKQSFVLLPRRQAVERSFAWATRLRRLVKDHERRSETV